MNYIAMTVTHVEHHRPHHSSKLHWDTVEVLQLPVPVVVVEIDAIALEHASCRDQVQGYQEQGLWGGVKAGLQAEGAASCLLL